ncbi:ricin-type beta-trefoil lectin domain protein [Kitasatospora sp. NPDC048239]|uniref:ricin-type beta-trefoil lectin domain protein n=1 Tax=Kitasatospora sp. NPDC048239 TaxID=3364046 RepID=UPI00370F7755
MRRTSALLATALLSGAAALTAPAASATGTSATGSAAQGAQSAQSAQSAPAVAGPGGVGNCTVGTNGWGFSGTCSGIDPMQTWSVGGTCVSYDYSTGMPSYSYTSSLTVAGNTTVTTMACYPGTPYYGSISFGPAAPAGPVGQITGFANKCLDVRGGSIANGTPTQIWDCLGNVNQTWKVGADGTIRAVGACLEAQGGNTANGTRVQTWACNGTGSQQWRVRADGSLLNPQSGRCLDVTGVSSANGTQVQLWDCLGTANQTWRVPA